MPTVINLTFDSFAQIIGQILNAGALPLLLGTFSSGVLQWIKKSPLFPVINSNPGQAQAWLNRGLLCVLATCTQILFMVISRQPIDVHIIQQLVVTYFAATTSYSHIFKPLEAVSIK